MIVSPSSIKPVMFSSELDVLEWHRDGGKPFDFVVSVSTENTEPREIFRTTLYPDAHGDFILTGFSQILRDGMDMEPGYIDIPNLLATYVVPSTVAPSLQAREWVKNFPLSLAGSRRTAYYGDKVYCPLLLGTGKWTLTIGIKAYGQTQVSASRQLEVTDIYAPHNVQVDFTKILAPFADYPHEFTATLTAACDNPAVNPITVQYDVRPKPGGATTLYFQNAFGLAESMPIASTERTAKAKGQLARIAGVLRSYAITDDTSYKGLSPVMHDCEGDLAADFLRSPDVCDAEGNSLVLTGGSLKSSTEDNYLLRVSAEWQVANNLPPLTVRLYHIFDFTFDMTFN